MLAQLLIQRSLAWARFPIALVLSTDASNTVHHLVERLRGNDMQALISHIQVNVLADTFMKKTLLHVCKQERLALSTTDLASVMSNAGGDLRHALHSMQFLAMGRLRQTVVPGASRGSGKRPHSASGAAVAGKSGDVIANGEAKGSHAGAERDRFPDMFHALGSILHRPNKRLKMLALTQGSVSTTATSDDVAQEQQDTQLARGQRGDGVSVVTETVETTLQGNSGGGSAGGSASGSEGGDGGRKAGSTVGARYGIQRPDEQQVDGTFSPEAIIESSALEEPSAAAFLHQNYLEYFSTIEEVAAAAGTLSDASALAEAQRRRPWQTPLLAYVASLAGRGVVSHNMHPAPSRRAQIRKPHMYAVERESCERARRLSVVFRSTTTEYCDRLYAPAELAVDVLPYHRIFAQCSSNRSSTVQRLDDGQWTLMVELTTFGGRLAPPRPQLPPIVSVSAHVGDLHDQWPEGGASCAAAAVLLADEDEIEE